MRDDDPTESMLAADATSDESNAPAVTIPCVFMDNLDSSHEVDEGTRTDKTDATEHMATTEVAVPSARGSDNGDDDMYEEAFDNSARSTNDEVSTTVDTKSPSDATASPMTDRDALLQSAPTSPRSVTATKDAVDSGTTDTDAIQDSYRDKDDDEAPSENAVGASRSSTARYSDDASTPRANDSALDAGPPMPLTSEPTLGNDGTSHANAAQDALPTARDNQGLSARYSDDGEFNPDTLTNDGSGKAVAISEPGAPSTSTPPVEGEDEAINQLADVVASSDVLLLSNADSAPIQEPTSTSEPPALDEPLMTAAVADVDAGNDARDDVSYGYDDEPSASGDPSAKLDTVSTQDAVAVAAIARPVNAIVPDTTDLDDDKDTGRYSSASPRSESPSAAESVVASPRASPPTNTGDTRADGIVAVASDLASGVDAPLQASASTPSTIEAHGTYDEDEYSTDIARDEGYWVAPPEDRRGPDTTTTPQPVEPATSGDTTDTEAVDITSPSAALKVAANVDGDEVYEDDPYENDLDTGRYSSVSADTTPAEASVTALDKTTIGSNDPLSVPSGAPPTDADATEYDDDTELYGDDEASPPVATSALAAPSTGANVPPPMFTPMGDTEVDETVNDTDTSRYSDLDPESTIATLATIESTSMTAPEAKAVAPLPLERAAGDDNTPRYSDDGSARADAAPMSPRTVDPVASSDKLPTQDNPFDEYSQTTARYSDDGAPVEPMPSLPLASNAVTNDTFDSLYTPPGDHRRPSLAKRGSVSSVMSLDASPLPSDRSYDNDFDDPAELLAPDATLLHAESSYSLDEFDA
ncbi:hypothetical protein SPRG_15075 [Saprolegnia parasitica CBS 223.65]|uniref:Uncharacterized protein n=1 Tax=Saprolegnia parasitica (strain CBS 223.65) TaxID=695850 RepID=A0A067BSF8_SAPPC|nr:hypothetical protein SPRG_15075 [Saprolegnia parasitica CBS 223.65]KDO19745.1 hypothetical protein SPRG_15075 [Saprolegnia parasitica CBS 223.65]|eukprot:XP_012209556.1 hypothetical protein SPRG_15075 [Saprolegnia parasitica CBS 223.65]